VELITQAEYARRRGVAKSAVAKAVAEKRISLIDGKIDPAVADIQWARNTRARADAGRPADEVQTSAPRSGPASQPAAPAGEPVRNDGGGQADYNFDRARRERYEADLAQIKLLEQQGELVRVVEVRAEIAKRIGQVRTNLLQIPARLAPLLANEADQAKCHAMLDAELRTVLTNLSQGDRGIS